MPITEPEWESIAKLAAKVAADVAGNRRDFFVTGKVIKVDEKNKCVYLQEFGSQPIPLVGFDYEVTIYDETPRGANTTTVGTAADVKILKKKVKVAVVMPKRGQNVLVARELGTSRIPRCLGVIQGKNWITPGAE